MWSKPLLNKETSTVLEAFDDIIQTLEVKPLYICTDLGKVGGKFLTINIKITLTSVSSYRNLQIGPSKIIVELKA